MAAATTTISRPSGIVSRRVIHPCCTSRTSWWICGWPLRGEWLERTLWLWEISGPTSGWHPAFCEWRVILPERENMPEILATYQSEELYEIRCSAVGIHGTRGGATGGDIRAHRKHDWSPVRAHRNPAFGWPSPDHRRISLYIRRL